METTTTTTTTQSKPHKLFKTASYYHKYSCESCNYFTNYKNSYNKHVKSAKHMALLPKEETELEEDVLQQTTPNAVSKNDTEYDNTEVKTRIIMDASMGFVTVEEKENVNEENENKNGNDSSEQLSKVFELVDNLSVSINNDLRIKYFYFGMGFFFNFFILFNLCLFHLFVRSQRPDFFELSG
jgi:hypothetical protein